jgi:SNF2 family DNA or RNA helicase
MDNKNMQLFKHQQDGVEFIKSRNGVGALYFDCGLGKTITALEIKKILGVRMFVVCPLTLIHNAWIEDINKYGTFTYQDLHAPKALENIQTADIYLCNYETLLNKKKLEIIKQLTQGMFIVIDESSRMKNYSSQTSKILLSIKHLYPYRILLSGTPAPNDETEYYTQMKFLNDTIYPQSFFSFRNQYFQLSRGKQIQQLHGQIVTKDLARKLFSQGWKYTISAERRNQLLDRMKPYVLFIKLEDRGPVFIIQNRIGKNNKIINY